MSIAVDNPSGDSPELPVGDKPLLGYATRYRPAAGAAEAPIAFRQGTRLIAFNGKTLPGQYVERKMPNTVMPPGASRLR
jgi:hypothetical protein